MTDEASKPGAVRVRVLIADDSAAIRTSLSALITRLNGVELVGLARNGVEALEMIRSLKPDVVTLDVRMPEMTGIKVLENLKREKLGPTVIVLTGVTDQEYGKKCAALGAKYFFNKATEFEKVIEVLNERVRELARTGAVVPPTTPSMPASSALPPASSALPPAPPA